MKARFMERGRPVKVNGRVMIFIMRYKDGPAHQRNVLQCDDYRGIDGPNDKGLTVMSDHYFAKNATVPTVVETREALKRVPALLEELTKKEAA